jgi:hypothetical protein
VRTSAARLLTGLLLLTAAAAPVAAQARAGATVEVSSGVEPAEVTVGDPFRAAIRVTAPAGVAVEFPPQLDLTDAYELLESMHVVMEVTGEGDLAVYTLVAWQTGPPAEPIVPVRLFLPDGVEQVLRVTLPMPTVRSVLPADTAGIEPRGAKSIIPQDRQFPYWILLALLALLLLAAIAAWRWLARRRGSGAPLLVGSPRERALAELEHARSLGLIEAGQWKPFFSQVSDTLRRYLQAVSPRWTTDLTTDELLRAVHRHGMTFEQAAALQEVLQRADLVKFARYRPTAEEAEETWHASRELVQAIDADVREDATARAGVQP